VEAQALTWWVRDVVVAETRKVPSCDEWLENEHYRPLLDQEQWGDLVNTVRDATERKKRGIGALAQELFETLRESKNEPSD
jgi:primase-polymerase (primpol)-like protein